MGKIQDSSRTFVNQCAKCNHAEFLHMRLIGRKQLEHSECTECKKLGKSCKTFKAK